MKFDNSSLVALKQRNQWEKTLAAKIKWSDMVKYDRECFWA